MITTKHEQIMQPNLPLGLEEGDKLAAAVAKTVNRVTLDQIISKIEHTDYCNPDRHPHMTLCIITLTNGYVIVGKSTPADPLNFDADLGRKFAREDAIRQIWPLEAYALRERMTKAD